MTKVNKAAEEERKIPMKPTTAIDFFGSTPVKQKIKPSILTKKKVCFISGNVTVEIGFISQFLRSVDTKARPGLSNDIQFRFINISQLVANMTSHSKHDIW